MPGHDTRLRLAASIHWWSTHYDVMTKSSDQWACRSLKARGVGDLMSENFQPISCENFERRARARWDRLVFPPLDPQSPDTPTEKHFLNSNQELFTPKTIAVSRNYDNFFTIRINFFFDSPKRNHKKWKRKGAYSAQVTENTSMNNTIKWCNNSSR